MDDDDGFRTSSPTRDNPTLSLVRGNVALLVPVVAALIFAIRCLAVARGDRYTAYLLIATTTIGDAIRALAFLIVPVGLALNSIALIVVIGQRGKLDRTSAGLAAASLVSYIAAVYLRGRPSWADLFIYILIFFICLYRIIQRLHTPGRPLRTILMSTDQDARAVSATLVTLMAATIVVAGVWIAGDTFWLPRERLDFQNEAPFSGYVLKESGDYLVILKDRPRVIIERKKDTLDGRDFCHPVPTDKRLVSEKVQSNTPVCP